MNTYIAHSGIAQEKALSRMVRALLTFWEAHTERNDFRKYQISLPCVIFLSDS